MSHNMVNFGLPTAEICWQVWGIPANFSGFSVLASLLQRRRSTEVNQTSHDVLPSPGLAGTLYIHFPGLLPRNGILRRAKFTLCPSLAFYIGSVTLLHGTRAVGVSESLRRRTRNGITELSQREPPIFDWAAIMLGIGPHSSYEMVFTATTFL